MLKTKDGFPITSEALQTFRRRKHMWVSAHLAKNTVACDAKKADGINFLLQEDRCCYCNVPRQLHR